MHTKNCIIVILISISSRSWSQSECDNSRGRVIILNSNILVETAQNLRRYHLKINVHLKKYFTDTNQYYLIETETSEKKCKNQNAFYAFVITNVYHLFVIGKVR